MALSTVSLHYVVSDAVPLVLWEGRLPRSAESRITASARVVAALSSTAALASLAVLSMSLVSTRPVQVVPMLKPCLAKATESAKRDGPAKFSVCLARFGFHCPCVSLGMSLDSQELSWLYTMWKD